MDDAFRRQLETAEKAHREELAKMTSEKQREVDMAEQRVSVLSGSVCKSVDRMTHGEKSSLCIESLCWCVRVPVCVCVCVCVCVVSQ